MGHNDKNSIKLAIIGVISIVGYSLLSMSLSTCSESKKGPDYKYIYEWYKEANAFKYEYIEIQDSLVVLYEEALKDVKVDKGLQSLIEEQEAKLDSLCETR